MTTQAKPFEVRGVHVFAVVASFFAVIIGVNATFIVLATRSFPGLSVEEPFTRGLAKNVNADLDARAEQRERGWTAVVQADFTPGAKDALSGGLLMTFKLADRDGAPLTGLAISARLSRPVTDAFDHALTVHEIGPGLYEARVLDVGRGEWLLELTADSRDGTPFEARRKLWLTP